MLLCPILSLLGGFLGGVGYQRLMPPRVVEAKEFRLIDENGLTRGGLGFVDGNPLLGIQTQPKDGKFNTVLLTVSDEWSGLSLAQEMLPDIAVEKNKKGHESLILRKEGKMISKGGIGFNSESSRLILNDNPIATATTRPSHPGRASSFWKNRLES